MCRFSRAVHAVSDTSIFARGTGGGRQILVYGMKLAADEELAMILGLPVQPGGGEGALRFVDMSSHAHFFEDLAGGFPSEESWSTGGERRGGVSRAPLPVVEVGSFEASYVPSVGDFDRLDPRFRLPPSAWDEQPGHAGFGFAVFKLKPGERRIHPMAFEFPRADPTRLFFPTVHVHDGQMHPTATFDHALYYQRGDPERTYIDAHWEESEGPAYAFMQGGWRSTGAVEGTRRVYRRRIVGEARNEDVYV